jgi:hypothetical protein
MFLRARALFLKLFYRGLDAADAADADISFQSIQAAIAARDFDSVRFFLFEQMFRKSKKHVMLLWLAFAKLPGDSAFSRITSPLLPLTFASAHSPLLPLIQLQSPAS